MGSATIDTSQASPRHPNLRAYLAGGGATAALVAGAVTVFVGAAAFVGFNGLPFGADESSSATVNLAAGASEAAAAASAPAADAVAADPATPSAAAIAEILAALPPGATPTIPGATPGTPGFGGGGSNPPGVAPPILPPPPAAAGPGAVGNAVGGLENTAGNLGLDLPLSEATDDVTGPLDETINDTVNGVGGLLGDPQLGDKVTGGVNDAVDGLIGPGGLTDSLLGGGQP